MSLANLIDQSPEEREKSTIRNRWVRPDGGVKVEALEALHEAVRLLASEAEAQRGIIVGMAESMLVLATHPEEIECESTPSKTEEPSSSSGSDEVPPPSTTASESSAGASVPSRHLRRLRERSSGETT